MNKPYAVLFVYDIGMGINIRIGDTQYEHHLYRFKAFWRKIKLPSNENKKLHRTEIDMSTAVKILKLLGYNETKTG